MQMFRRSVHQMIDKSSVVYKADLVARFIANQHQSVQRDNGRPLLVSMQGPQGAGEHYLGLTMTVKGRALWRVNWSRLCPRRMG